MAVLGLFFMILVVLLVAILFAIGGIILLRRHRAHKTQPFLKYGITLPEKAQLILGAALIVLSVVFLFWVVWSGVEWIMVRL